MQILVTGQCTLHWGRLEFGNLGSYAIIEPLFKELHRVFHDAEIRTTFQMTNEFYRRERISMLPMGMYYGWKNNDLIKSLYEVLTSALMRKKIPYFLRTGFVTAVMESDLVIDYSGDMWGDNADLAGKNRFIIGLFKDLTAHFLGKKITMIAGSPGPFSGFIKRKLAKYVFGKFDLVTNREEISTQLLQKDNLPTERVHNLACPAFLFQCTSQGKMEEIFRNENLEDDSPPKVGFVVCGWNMSRGPFGLWPREDSEYDVFAETVEFIINRINAMVYLLSHNNGFIPPPDFKMTEGRDHKILRQLMDVLSKRGKTQKYRCLTAIYNTAETKSIIGRFDMLVTGRIHAAVSGFTQFVPTVIIDYGHEPKAHKLRGFAKLAGMTDYIANPADIDDMINKINSCWNNRDEIRNQLKENIPRVKMMSQESFELLRQFSGRKV